MAKPKPLDPVLPFCYFAAHKREMLDCMHEIRHDAGIRHFALILNDNSLRYNGAPDDSMYAEIGDIIAEVKAELAGEDFTVSWWNINTLRAGPGASYTPVTGLNGGVSPIAYCPLDPGFRAAFIRRNAEVAKRARPHMILIEDDYTFCNQTNTEGFACFCGRHVAELAKRTGVERTREELAKLFMETTPESRHVRKCHWDMTRDTLSGFAADTAAAVQAVSPETRMGLCQPGGWMRDGNMTETTTLGFAGRNRPYIRICGATYNVDTPTNLPSVMFSALYTAEHLPDTIDKFYEADTFPHNRFFCSAPMLESMCANALAYGCEDFQFYAANQQRNALVDRGYFEMYAERRDWFAALRAAREGATNAGLRLICLPEVAAIAPWNGRGFAPGGLPTGASQMFGRYGFPYTTFEGSVDVLSGAVTVSALDDSQIRAALSGKILIDGLAAAELSKRGFSELIGSDVEVDAKYQFNREIVNGGVAGFEDMAETEIYSMAYLSWGSEFDSISLSRPLRGAEIITVFADVPPMSRDPHGAVVKRAGITRFENALGGKVVVCPVAFSSTSSNTFTYAKRELLRRLVAWMDPEALPVSVDTAPNVMVAASRMPDGGLLVAVTNLGSANARPLALLASPAYAGGAVSYLGGSEWVPADGVSWNGGRLVVDIPLHVLSPQVFRISQTH